MSGHFFFWNLKLLKKSDLLKKIRYVHKRLFVGSCSDPRLFSAVIYKNIRICALEYRFLCEHSEKNPPKSDPKYALLALM